MKAALIALPLLLALAGWSGSADGCDDDDAPNAPAVRERVAERPATKRGPVAIKAIAAADLCITSGGLARTERGRVRVDGPKMRTVAPSSSGDVGELRFQYRGATEKVAPLASGQIRRQVGLKLRAADGCNLVYAMWRIEPKPGIEVQVKRNLGSRVNSECGTRGYRKISPRRHTPVPTLQPGSEHTLRAEIAGQELTVWADGAKVWEGDLGSEVLALTGPVGMRSDNVALDIELLADTPKVTGSLAKVAGGCDSAADSD